MKISKEASRKIPAGLGLLLILELCFGGSSARIAELFNVSGHPTTEQTEVHDGRYKSC